MKSRALTEFSDQKFRVLNIRGQRVLLDADLARLYGVETRALNQAVKRNLGRFPSEFSFLLNRKEILSISQTVISLTNIKFVKSARVFTEYGALQAANVLNSKRAVQMSLYIIRAFVKMREELATNATILKRLAEIDKTLLAHDSALQEAFERLLPLLEPAEPSRRRIGFNRENEE
ncbi:MAG TPA: ORF6N domain-containing protein [Pseudomonadales bacterium]|nr:ORF6N domain-containing protein [Pseudomonadales bacterium]